MSEFINLLKALPPFTVTTVFGPLNTVEQVTAVLTHAPVARDGLVVKIVYQAAQSQLPNNTVTPVTTAEGALANASSRMASLFTPSLPMDYGTAYNMASKPMPVQGKVKIGQVFKPKETVKKPTLRLIQVKYPTTSDVPKWRVPTYLF
jgi:hypothetical protein